MLAALPDHGALLAYDEARPGHGAKGASGWHAVQLSEAHALRAIVDGEMTVEAPDGRLMRLGYQRHVEHPDGNWTWIGTERDARGGNAAIITFGEKAVFGSIPYRGRQLQLTTSGGKAWLVEPGSRTAAGPRAVGGDTVVPGTLVDEDGNVAVVRSASNPLALPLEAAVTDGTVDLVVGYTHGFSERLGGASQAITRLTFMVDVVNQALVDSNAEGQIRLVRAVEVDYPDATTNRAALFELTGVECVDRPNTGELPDGGVACTRIGQPASLQPLAVVREHYRADLVSLVRKLEMPENASCSASWNIGGGQSVINQNDAAFGFSVVSDSSGSQFPDEGTTCRDETLAHALGHNMGLQHDRATAQGSDDTNGDGNLLDPEEYGRYPYSFGYSADAANGNFHTIMSNRTPGQTALRIYSNPDIATCGGSFACGVADVADNARTLRQTMPMVANFRVERLPTTVHNDVDGDGRSDVLLHRAGSFAYWIMDGATIRRSRSFSVANDWRVVATGDLDANGKLDIVWMNSSRQLYLWRGDGNTFTSQFIVQMASGYVVVGAGDLNLDGREDLMLHRPGQLVQWWMNGATITRSKVHAVDSSLVAAATGDFNTDGFADVVFKSNLGDLHIWLATPEGGYARYIALRVNTTYGVAASQDINADARSDLLLFRPGQVVQLLINGVSISSRAFSLSTSYAPATTGAFNGPGPGDLILQHRTNRSLYMWLGTATGYTSLPLATPATGYVVIR